jgi:polysaccharide biosynthesis protein PslH
MNILFLVKEFPHSKVIGGPIIVFNRVKYLSENHEVSLIAFAGDVSREEVASVERYTRDLSLVPLPAGRNPFQKAGDFLVGPVPPYFMLSYSEQMYEALREMVRKPDYDVIISEYSMVSQYLYRNPDLVGIKRVMSVHECYYLARKKAWKMHGPGGAGLEALYHLKGLRRFEFDMYADADRVLTLTPQGRDELLSIRGDLDISVVPHGVDVDEYQPMEREPGPPTVMFLGNYPHDPNRDAVVYFAAEVWPLVRKEVKGARFLVVGRGPTGDMLALADRDPSIEITGEVDDVRPFFRASDVFVCPVRMGGGFRGKVLEAMACGVPVVSTPLGAEGLPAEDGGNLMLAETPAGLADKTVRLLEDRALNRKISESARRLVVDRYSWRTGVKELESVLRNVVAG